jgi:ubiquinone/menaquinone biosynthesis C-methylase UbiE
MGEQDEIDRLQYMHEIFNMMFDNRLIFPPIPRPRRILECGSGSGAWAMEVAEQHPECEVGEPALDEAAPVFPRTSDNSDLGRA